LIPIRIKTLEIDKNESYVPDQEHKLTDVTTPSDLGIILRAARKRSGLTQQQFADICGVGRRFLSECEAGKPRLELGKVLQVLKAAGIDVKASLR
jgi:y4mF family transcriptional regulator